MFCKILQLRPKLKKIMKKIAVINDISGFGKCSLTAALPIISAFGIQCCPLVTGIYSNQTGYDSFYCRDCTDDMAPYIEEWKKLDAHFDAILSGFISNSRQGTIISDFIKYFRTNDTLVIVDPVMADDGEIYKCYDKNSIEAIKSLAHIADIITPNLTELCFLCDKDYSKINSLSLSSLLNEIYEMSYKLNKASKKTVITTGINISENEIANAVFKDGKFNLIRSRKFHGSFSGTGDIFSSFIAAQAVNNVGIIDAVKNASEFISQAVSETINDANEKYKRADGIHFEKFLHTLGISD